MNKITFSEIDSQHGCMKKRKFYYTALLPQSKRLISFWGNALRTKPFRGPVGQTDSFVWGGVTSSTLPRRAAHSTSAGAAFVNADGTPASCPTRTDNKGFEHVLLTLSAMPTPTFQKRTALLTIYTHHQGRVKCILPLN
jgi:hypothetical protein